MRHWPTVNREKEVPKQESLLDEKILVAIQSFETPAESILESLSPSIEDGSIGAVIGIDGGGRHVATMLSGMITTLYEKRGFTPPVTSFVAVGQNDSGKYGNQSEEGRKRLEIAITHIAESIDPSRKILIVDDTLDSGASVSLLAGPLKKKGFQVEVVAFSSFTKKGSMQVKKSELLTEEQHARRRELVSNLDQVISRFGYGPEARRAREEMDAELHPLLYFTLPLHVGVYGGNEMAKLPVGATRIPNVPYLPPYVTDLKVEEVKRQLQNIGDGVVSRYEAKRKTAL